MSSSYVRALVKGWLSAPAFGIPFYNTENEVQTPVASVWATVEWSFPDKQRYTFCSSMESADFNIVFLGAMGNGDEALLIAAEAAMLQFALNSDSTGVLQITEIGAPYTFSDEKNYFCIAFPVSYEYQP